MLNMKNRKLPFSPEAQQLTRPCLRLRIIPFPAPVSDILKSLLNIDEK
jgi:hypothetical protein